MKSKWNIYIGSITIFLSIIAIAVAVATPEVRCRLGLETNQCPEDSEMKKVDLIVQNESQQPLSTVNVEFISDGPPEPVLTDANGYAQIKIPSTTDVQITLRKDGFETKSYRIDLKKDPGLTRKYTLKSTSPLTPPTPPDEPSPVPPSPSPTEPSLTPISPISAKPPKVECKIVDEIVDRIFNDGKYTETIPVANKPEQPVSRLYVTRDNPRSVVCKIQKSFGELPLAYALPENSQLDSIVTKVYIDGKLRKNIDLNRGEALREKIDIKGASTYKLEFSVPDKSDKGDYIYVLEK
ncbi:hypothetical protein QUA07_20340 [Microcoleus sp. T3_A4]|uniref:hypothetical protein n=1 Tax=Microcoleus sp. T3_A4 TaxID=2818968 RepID=UPI002FD32B32